MSHDVALVTWNEKGFWQADLYRGAGSWDREDWNSCPEPDDFFTGKRTQNADDVANRACEKWPKTEVQILAMPDTDDGDGSDDVFAGDPA